MDFSFSHLINFVLQKRALSPKNKKWTRFFFSFNYYAIQKWALS